VSETRAPLSRERVLAAAVALADEGGIESLSMRGLAASLGVEAMSLYHHVAGKDAILAGIVETVVDEFELPSARDGWKASLRRSAISAHDALVRHRWAPALWMSTEPGPGRLRYMEALLATLRESGFSAELTHHAYHAVDAHVVGFALWRASLPRGDELTRLAADFLAHFPADDHPFLAEHIRMHLADDAATGRDEFAFGLDLILDGLERLRDR
jgi:AcrR family transcriptional regulator